MSVNPSIRMGSSRRRNRSAGGWWGAAAAVLLLSAGVVLWWLPMREAPNRDRDGCMGDNDCNDGQLCVDGGCMVLLEKEIRQMWREAILLQLDPKRGVFKPRPAFGIRLQDPEVCPGKVAGKTAKSDGGATTLHYDATVYVYGTDHLRTIQQRKAEGTMWMDRIRFRFSSPETERAEVFCHGKTVKAIQVMPGKAETTVDAFLLQAAPAHTPAEATVMRHQFLPRSGGETERVSTRLTFSTSPSRDSERREVTTMVLPFGTDVLSLEGSPPLRQRLLTGYVAYYWPHGERRQNMTVELRLPIRLRTELDLSEVMP